MALGYSYSSGVGTGDCISGVLDSQVSPVISDDTLGSIGIGGNDIGFTDALVSCVTESDSGREDVVTAPRTRRTSCPARWTSSCRHTVERRRPASSCSAIRTLYDTGVSGCVGLSDAEHKAMNEGADVLDSVISAAAGSAGFAPADPRSSFAGHELCADDGWLRAITTPIDESYHPTATGQSQGYLPTFTSAPD